MTLAKEIVKLILDNNKNYKCHPKSRVSVHPVALAEEIASRLCVDEDDILKKILDEFVKRNACFGIGVTDFNRVTVTWRQLAKVISTADVIRIKE